jgi:peptidoglycan L-alanyl-D-glutamate endopeptidase CwlK
MLDSISQERLKPVHPELSKRIYALDALLEPDGINIRVTRGLATFAEQAAIYEQGRGAAGIIVTNAKAGFSAHNFGYAVDAAPDDPDFPAWVPDWDARDDRWKDLLAKALTCGLAEGAQWRSVKPDSPHLYLKELPATPEDAMRAELSEGGMPAVFAEIDRRLAAYAERMPAQSS